MNNILKSTKLDFSLVKPYIKVIGFTMLLPIAFAAINRSILTGVSFAMFFIAMTTGYTFSVTEKNSMERLYGILPIKKSEMVTGRYLFVLALGALALVVSLITQPLVLRAMGESVGTLDMISAAIGGLFLFALYTVFQIPGYYKYGAIKGRVFMYIPVAGFLATLFFLPKMHRQSHCDYGCKFPGTADRPCACTRRCHVRCVDLVLHSDYGKQGNVR